MDTLRPPSAPASPKPASYSSPSGPVFRAIPFPEVTELICRLPFPTLFYRPEAIDLGDLLRIWVRTGASRRNLNLDFQGSTGRSRTHRELMCSLQSQNPFSSQRNSRASDAYTEKKTLPGVPADVSRLNRVAT